MYFGLSSMLDSNYDFCSFTCLGYVWCVYTLQVLIYPKVTVTNATNLKSNQEYKDGPIVTQAIIDW